MDTEDTRQWLLFMGPQIEKQTSKIQNQNHAISANYVCLHISLKKKHSEPFFSPRHFLYSHCSLPL